MTARTAQGAAAVRAAVWAALHEVRDPELDEPVTDLGFVASCRVEGDGTARVRLRLPTYFCAANFAYLMVADAREAVSRVAGVSRVDVALDGHFAAETINAGVAERRGFVATFGELAADELDGLRRDFLRKAVLASTDRVCRLLVEAGLDAERLPTLTLGEVAPTAELLRLRGRRAELGLSAGDGDPLVVDPCSGRGVDAASVGAHLRRARLTRVSVEANGEFCRALLRQRYAETSVNVTGRSS